MFHGIATSYEDVKQLGWKKYIWCRMKFWLIIWLLSTIASTFYVLIFYK